VQGLVRHMPGQQNPLDAVVTQRRAPDAASPDPDVLLVGGCEDTQAKPRILAADVARGDQVLRHDPEKLARVLMDVYAAGAVSAGR
ncbi:MAG: hypothetical protein JO023_04830, partial [Chloroflexi bacterium]|nr:hypothetical protein [Chloroflexota bacterium]